jgi:rRNA maturation endonuclease Nob1
MSNSINNLLEQLDNLVSVNDEIKRCIRCKKFLLVNGPISQTIICDECGKNCMRHGENSIFLVKK